MPVNTTFHGTVLVVRKQANPATVQQGTPPRNRSVTAFLAASGASPWGGEPPLAGGGGVEADPLRASCTVYRATGSTLSSCTGGDLGEMTTNNRRWLA